MRLSHGLAALAMLATASVAHAELSGTVTAISDYDFRGVTQSAQDPALQGSLDWASDNGFYVGVWASNIDFGNEFDADIEVDGYAGFTGGEDIVWDVGLVYYAYPGETDANYAELYGSVAYQWIKGKIWYSDEFAGYGHGSSLYYDASATWELPSNFGLNAHIGYSDGNGIDDTFGDSYMDWSVGVTYALGNFTLGLKWVDGSDLEAFDGTPGDISSSEARAIFSVSTTFPWGE